MLKLLYVGPFTEETGYGIAAREYARAFLSEGLDVRLIPSKSGDVPPDLSPFVGKWANGHPTHILIHSPPDTIDKVAELAPMGFIGSPTWLAYTTWETFYLPEAFATKLAAFDAVFVPSALTHIQLNLPEDVPVLVLPHTFHPKDWPHQTGPLGSSSRPYTFLWMGDWSERKNPIGVLKTYWGAFERSDNVLLKLKLSRYDRTTIQFLIEQSNRAEDLAPIELLTERLSHEEIRKLYDSADCFISLSRGDAWNLPLFQAALLGMPIIFNENVGHMEFMWMLQENESVCMVPSTGTPCFSTTFQISAGPEGVRADVFEPKGIDSSQMWCEPNLMEAGRAMRQFREKKMTGRFFSFRDELEKNFSYKAVTKAFVEAVTNL